MTREPHTPGPWTVESVMSDYLHDIILGYSVPQGGSPIVVASVDFHEEGESRVISPRQADANARLIAAAPDLLAACKLFAEWDNGNRSLDIPNDVDTAIRNAIAKATGQ